MEEMKVQRQVESKGKKKKVDLKREIEGIYTPENSFISQAGRFQPIYSSGKSLYLGAARLPFVGHSVSQCPNI